MNLYVWSFRVEYDPNLNGVPTKLSRPWPKDTWQNETGGALIFPFYEFRDSPEKVIELLSQLPDGDQETQNYWMNPNIRLCRRPLTDMAYWPCYGPQGTFGANSGPHTNDNFHFVSGGLQYSVERSAIRVQDGPGKF